MTFSNPTETVVESSPTSGSDDLNSMLEIGPYRLIRVLGQGQMGVVWLASRRQDDALVAIKFLSHAEFSTVRRDWFAREIQTLSKLRHPYIARLYDAGTLAESASWFVMEYVEGERLADYCSKRDLSMEARLALFYKICGAVQYAHSRKIIHRDLNSSNILVESNGNPRLLDFGIAREVQGADDRGIHSDLHALEIILYELLTGQQSAALPALAEDETARAMELDPAV